MMSNQLGIKNYFNLIKSIYKNPASKIILNDGNQKKLTKANKRQGDRKKLISIYVEFSQEFAENKILQLTKEFRKTEGYKVKKQTSIRLPYPSNEDVNNKTKGKIGLGNH